MNTCVCVFVFVLKDASMNKCMSTCVGICVCIHVCVCFYLSLSTYLLLALRLALMLKRRARLAGPLRCKGGRRGSLAETQETFMRWCSCTYKFKHTNAHIYTHTRMTHVCMYMRTHACTQGMARHGTAQHSTDARTHGRAHTHTHARMSALTYAHAFAGESSRINMG